MKNAAAHSPATTWSDPTNKRIGPVRFGLVLVLIMIAESLVNSTLSALGPSITRDLGMTAGEFGLLVSAFSVASMVALPLAGMVVDRVSSRALLGLLFCVSAMSFTAVALAPSAEWILAAALIAGAFGALASPLSNRMLISYAPAGQRGWLTGIKQSGVQLGVLLAGTVIPLVALATSWRGAVFACVLIPLLGLAISLRMPHTPGDHVQGATRQARLSWWSLLRTSPVLRWITPFAFLMGFGRAALLAYLPLFAVHELGLTMTAAAAPLGVVGLLGVVARIAWARLAERSASRAPALLCWFAAASVSAVVLLVTSGVAGLWLCALLAGGMMVAWNAVGTLVLINAHDGNGVGRASSVMQLGFAAGMATGPALFGGLVEASRGYTGPWLVVMASFALAAAVAFSWHTQRSRRTT